MKSVLTLLMALVSAALFGAGQAVTVSQDSAHTGTFNTAGVTSYVISQPVTFTGGTTFNPLPIQASLTTIALLRSYAVTSAIVNGAAIQVTGYYAQNDGGGGVYVWNSTSTASDDGGTVIQATGVATGRWLLQITNGQLSVAQFGTKGDGVTDDAPAIKNAITAATATGGPSVLFFPAGTYLLGSQLPLASNLWYKGAGIGATTLELNAANASVLSNWTGSAGPALTAVKVSDMTIDGNYGAVADGANDNYEIGIYMINVSNSEVYNVQVQNTWYSGIEVYTGKYNVIRDCFFSHCGDKTTLVGGYYYGLGLDEQSDNCIAQGNAFINCGSGINVFSFTGTESYIKLLGNRITSPLSFGISVADKVNSILIDGNSVYSSAQYGIALRYNAAADPGSPTITNNVVDTPNTGNTTDSGAIYVDASGRAIIEGNTISNANGTGSAVTRGIFVSANGTTSQNLIVNNTLSGTFLNAWAIQFTGNASIVTHNTINGQTTGSGINVISGTTGAIVTQNTFVNCATSLTDSGTSTTLDYVVPNNQALSWRDSGGTARRNVLSSGSNLFFGDIDNVGFDTYLPAGNGHAVHFRVNGSDVAYVNGSGLNIINNTPLRLLDGVGTAQRTLLSSGTNLFFGDIDNSGFDLLMRAGGSHTLRMQIAGSDVATVDASGLHLTGGSIAATAPSGGAGNWGLGGLRTSTGLAVSTTQGIQITIGGTTYTLAVLTTNP